MMERSAVSDAEFSLTEDDNARQLQTTFSRHSDFPRQVRELVVTSPGLVRTSPGLDKNSPGLFVVTTSTSSPVTAPSYIYVICPPVKMFKPSSCGVSP